MVSSSPFLVDGYLLDTGIFIADERNKFNLVGFVRDRPQVPCFMSAITAAELLIGPELASPIYRGQVEKNVEGYIASFPVLDFDIHCARQWAKIAAPLRAKGRNIGANDLLIAAIALRYNYAVITFNSREFSRIPDLVVITPERG